MALCGALLRASTMHESQAWLASRRSAKSASGKLWSRGVLCAVGLPLMGTASTYFVYDVVSWGVGSYTSTIFASSTNKGTIWNMLWINLMATPGFALTACMGSCGRKNFQLMGFLGMALCFFAVGFSYGQAPQAVLVLIFGFQKIFDSAGPGATTFIIPGEIFPTSVRASCHGLSSAAGKLGAFVGMYFFPALQRAVGFKGVLLLGGGLLIVGFALTLCLTPPYSQHTVMELKVATHDGDLSQTTAILWGRRRHKAGSDDSEEKIVDSEGDNTTSESGSE